MYKLSKKILAAVSAMGVLCSPTLINQAYATEAYVPEPGKEDNGRTTGKVSVIVEYSDDIEPQIDDNFVIEYSVKGREDNKGTIDVNAFSFAEEPGVLEGVPFGSYSILNIEYTGNNQDIVNQGYAVTQSFYCSDSVDGSFTIAVGESSIASLAKDYSEGNIRIKDSDHDEYGTATRDKVGTKYYDQEGNDKITDYELVSEGKDIPDRSEDESSSVGDETPEEEIVQDAEVNDKGTAKEIRYDETENDEEKEKAKDEEPSMRQAVAEKMLGVLILGIIGFGIIYFLHKNGKI